VRSLWSRIIKRLRTSTRSSASPPTRTWLDLRLPSTDVVDFRAKFLQEELDEFISSDEQDDLEGAVDALVDLVYVAYGTALLLGISPEAWQELFDDVQLC
jgi:predicted HAD superfamily Cof-like phosphohydrolase